MNPEGDLPVASDLGRSKLGRAAVLGVERGRAHHDKEENCGAQVGFHDQWRRKKVGDGVAKC